MQRRENRWWKPFSKDFSALVSNKNTPAAQCTQGATSLCIEAPAGYALQGCRQHRSSHRSDTAPNIHCSPRRSLIRAVLDGLACRSSGWMPEYPLQRRCPRCEGRRYQVRTETSDRKYDQSQCGPLVKFGHASLYACLGTCRLGCGGPRLYRRAYPDFHVVPIHCLLARLQRLIAAGGDLNKGCMRFEFIRFLLQRFGHQAVRGASGGLRQLSKTPL